jgi:hypothetical protein
VHIKTGDPFMYHIHRFPLFNRRFRRGDLSRMNSKKRAREAGRPLAQVGVRGTPGPTWIRALPHQRISRPLCRQRENYMTDTPRVENRFSSRWVGRRPVTNFDEARS